MQGSIEKYQYLTDSYTQKQARHVKIWLLLPVFCKIPPFCKSVRGNNILSGKNHLCPSNKCMNFIVNDQHFRKLIFLHSLISAVLSAPKITTFERNYDEILKLKKDGRTVQRKHRSLPDERSIARISKDDSIVYRHGWDPVLNQYVDHLLSNFKNLNL